MARQVPRRQRLQPDRLRRPRQWSHPARPLGPGGVDDYLCLEWHIGDFLGSCSAPCFDRFWGSPPYAAMHLTDCSDEPGDARHELLARSDAATLREMSCRGCNCWELACVGM